MREGRPSQAHKSSGEETVSLRTFRFRLCVAAALGLLILIGVTPIRDMFSRDDVSLDDIKPGMTSKITSLDHDHTQVDRFAGVVICRIRGRRLKLNGDVLCSVGNNVDLVLKRVGEPDFTKLAESGDDTRVLVFERMSDFRVELLVRGGAVSSIVLESKGWIPE